MEQQTKTSMFIGPTGDEVDVAYEISDGRTFIDIKEARKLLNLK